MASHSSTLAWKMEEPGGLQSMGSPRVGHYWATSLSLLLSCIGEGNGNPLQCSCLENLRDGAAWWAAIYGVASVVSDSVWPHRRQPIRLLHPWDSPGKNTGVGCNFLLQCMKVKVKVKSLSRVQLLVTSWTAAYQAPLSMGFSRQEYWSRSPVPSPNC